MRISEQEHHIIVDVLKRHFGESAAVWLFGSRADDNARGGDIDLMVETPLQSADEIVEAKLDALVELHQRLGDQKIDLVIKRPGGCQLPIHRVARESGIPL
ncbi:nucleotidyltransferase domain-containing protein [Halomonas sp. A11-A]|uniref:nucleotidyltransferase domain-containing protein n=1 Tax=Halomonas sp. A11-A TaxID=2183985 RepID=UPI000D70A7D0|nr:nucleotidyltransferase domain-containing protein [Halomonas sp. A11-A]PWV78260.1 nucleotidyltransferase-like protein [Halomonas sp. A11-A]